jgi:hypothetical protein
MLLRPVLRGYVVAEDSMKEAARQVGELIQRLVADGTMDEEATGGLVLRWVCYMDVRLPDGGDFYMLLPAPDTTRKDNQDLTMRGFLTELVDWTADAVALRIREGE